FVEDFTFFIYHSVSIYYFVAINDVNVFFVYDVAALPVAAVYTNLLLLDFQTDLQLMLLMCVLYLVVDKPYHLFVIVLNSKIVLHLVLMIILRCDLIKGI